MRRTATTLGAALIAATTMGDWVLADTLSDLRWDKRIVILFGTDQSRLDQQANAFLRDEAGLADRDMLVFAVVGDELRPIYGTVPSSETAARLRDRFGVDAATAYTAVLIGKDGGEKWRGSSPVPSAEIDGIVDAMPMRRSGG